MIGQMRAERRRFALMRLSFAGLFFLHVLFLLWAVPWIPVGMTAGDYSAAMAMLLILAAATAFASMGFLIVWAPAFRHEPLPEFLRVLFGSCQLIRGTRQFHSRLTAECRRARNNRRHTFSLIVIQLPDATIDRQEWPEYSRHEQQPAAMLVRSVVRAEDVVAASWPQEVWILAPGAGEAARRSIVHRLAHALRNSESLPSTSAGCIGGSTFGPDGEKPEDVFGAAYRRLMPIADVVQLPPAA